MSQWYAAKTLGRETRTMWYLNRAGIRAFWPETHKYFRDKRTQKEKHRILGTFTGYVFIRPNGDAEYSRAKSTIGVSYILGNYEGERFVPKSIPADWIEALENAGPLIVGKRRKFERGQKVRVIINRLAEVIGTVEAHAGHKVTLKLTMFGSEMEIDADEAKVELAT